MDDIAQQVRVQQVMVLLVGFGKCLLDLAIDPIPVASDLGIEPPLHRTQPVGNAFGLIVRAKITVAHQHLASLWQRISILSRMIVILEAGTGLQIAGIGAATRLLRQNLIQIRSHL